jgi:DNA primase
MASNWSRRSSSGPRSCLARERVRFTRRQLREHSGWGDTQLKVHLARLVSLELLFVRRGEHGAYLYELALDSAAHVYDADRSGPAADRSGAGRPPVGGRSGPGRPGLEAVA